MYQKYFYFGLCLLLTYTTANAQLHRPIDGMGTNQINPEWGSATSSFMRLTTPDFSDGYSTPGGTDRPNPRIISLALGAQDEFIPNEKNLSDFIWGWGQFIDHDINLNDDHPTDFLPIVVPTGDPHFDPDAIGGVEIPMRRSLFDPNSGTDPSNPRIHVNELTSFIDASSVYGVTEDRMNWLRTFSDGKLKTSAGNLLPFNTIDGELNSPYDTDAPFMLVDGVSFSDKLYVAGDIRANEQPGLTCFHTLFVREHNRLCDEIKADNPTWSDDEIFYYARKMVGAYMQAITYEEWLPSMGFDLDPYSGYDNTVNPSIFNLFSAAAYRFGHTMVNGRLLRFDENGDTLSYGSINLRDAFFNTTIIHEQGGIEPFFRGMAVQAHQMVDVQIMDDLRNFLFGPPGYGGLDLLSININRARERGIPDFNTIRIALGMPPLTSFSDLTSDADLANTLQTMYGTVNKIDPWIGFMAEDHVPNSTMGPTLKKVLSMQFQNLRDGDRYYYENDPMLSSNEKQAIKSVRLADIVRRNTSFTNVQDDIFVASPSSTVSVELFPFGNVRDIDIQAYPNPIQKHFTLTINAFSAGNAELFIIDNLGKEAMRKDVSLVKGENTLEFELDARLANGLYTIVLKSNDDFGKLKIIKHK